MTADPLAPVLKALSQGGGASSDFDLNPGTVLPEGRKLRPAGVLVPLIQREGRIEVILTKRSSQLKHHPGQVAFPGGKVDPDDADATAAALREAHEEIGLDPANVEVLGELPWHETVTNFTMTPVVGLIRAEFTVRPEPGEVEEVFRVPLDHIANPANFSIQSRQWLGRERRYFTAPFGPYYIWGATARILRGLAERMAE
ncbi:CoA pyrophosphatase [Rhodalgimonas zhirmunskyi]|uniref:CoA pyrophosphatase n=1 Tax=Rhodalgimonas zhirmunskyi TaxID=2964767 RepID=A0AAJ1X5K0_9RHOB|nr:CoA pyrophosphatase [Rhodoalgimonas zhirmunskyi]MDQ2094234.1 CoA pyrophosphatase [Rhodoalgimonas zhirmunskyi]